MFSVQLRGTKGRKCHCPVNRGSYDMEIDPPAVDCLALARLISGIYYPRLNKFTGIKRDK